MVCCVHSFLSAYFAGLVNIAVGIYVLVQETAKEVKTAVEESLLRSYNLEEAERMREGQSTVIYDL